MLARLLSTLAAVWDDGRQKVSTGHRYSQAMPTNDPYQLTGSQEL